MHGGVCTPGLSFFGRNLKICSDRYQFKISDVLSDVINFDNVIKQYCLDQVDEHCDRVAQFLKELSDTRDFYVRDATYPLSRVEICDTINVAYLHRQSL